MKKSRLTIVPVLILALMCMLLSACGGDAAEPTPEPTETPIAAPSADDPLDASVAVPGFESLVISYPATMKVAQTSDSNRFVQLDAVNDGGYENGISFNLIELGGSYEQRLNAGSTAQDAMLEIAGKVCDQTFPNMLISCIGSDFVDGDTYYSVVNYLWMSGEVFQEPAGTPIRGVLECRYYGNGYILAVFTLADEGVIQTYYEIACNIVNAIDFGSGWTTPDEPDPTVTWSDPGDYYYYGDYDPWSDPPEYDSEYNTWSDPGDYYDGEYTDASDPGDYYDGDIDPYSDPGDGY